MTTEARNKLNAIGLSTLALISAAFAVNLGGTLALKAQDGALAPRQGGIAQTPGATSAASAIGVGDRVKVSFFEMIDVGDQPGARGSAAPEPVLRTFYQRMDLSSEHTIDQYGVVSLPRLGSFQALGRSPAALRSELAAAFLRATGRAADVSVAVIERRPVYVLGPVRNVGAIKYVPEMMVLHAVALAGGMDRDATNAAEMIEAAREAERVSKLTDRLARLLARSARLEAERSGSTAMPATPQLIALTGNGNAEHLLTSERALLSLENARREQLKAEAASNVLAARKEVDALKSKLRELDTQSQIRDEHLQEMQRLKASGLTTRRGVVVTRTEVAEIQARKLDLNATLALAEARLAHAERTRVRIHYDHATELVKAIAATEAEITEVSTSLEAAGHLSTVLEQRTSRMVPGQTAAQPAYEIVRSGQDGPIVIAADETTQLLPGDILKIRLDQPSRSRGSQRPHEQAGYQPPQSRTK